MRYYRPTWAEVNLGSLIYNYHQIKGLVSAKTKIMACVKADAYGHGIIRVSQTLVSCGVDFLGVASIEEGITLRDAGIKVPVLILGQVLKQDVAPLFRHKLTPTVCSHDLAVVLDKLAALKNQKIMIHIKVDTGMGRLGVLGKDAPLFIKKISRLKHLFIEGVFTHFPSSDIDEPFTLRQIKEFKSLLTGLKEEGIAIPLAHAANSMAIIGYPQSHFNMVRPGLSLYGLYPRKNLNIKLRPVLSLKTKIVYLKKVPSGYGISYGRTYKTKSSTQIATLPIGYGDGYPRNLSNKSRVLIRGEVFSISGRVCMDQVMVDIGNFRARVGDEVALIGRQGQEIISVEELAGLSNTIPYEIVCGLGSRIPRVYT